MLSVAKMKSQATRSWMLLREKEKNDPKRQKKNNIEIKEEILNE